MTPVLSPVIVDPLKDVRELDARAARDLADWLAYLELEGKADRTVYEYGNLGCALLRVYPDKELSEITDADLSHFLRAMPAKSRHQRRAILSSFFKWARLLRRIDENPMDYVPAMKSKQKPAIDVYDEAEVALLESLPYPDGQLFALLFGTGIRRSEAIRMQRRHLNLERRLLAIPRAKGDKARVVPLLPSAVSAVLELDTPPLSPADHLWYSKPGGKRIARRDPIADSTFSKWYTRCVDEAGVRYLSPHKTRHTYATRLRRGIELERGLFRADLDELKEMLGHASIRTTSDLYVHTNVEDVARRLLELGA